MRGAAGWMILFVAACGAAPSHAVEAAYARLRVPVEECNEAGPEEVSPEAMERDWAELEHVLRRGYAGFELAAGEAGWARVFAEGRAAIPSEPASALAWRDFIVERLAFADDNHLAFWVHGPSGRQLRATSAHHLAHVSEEALVRNGEGFTMADGRALLSCRGRPASELVRRVWSETGPVLRVIALSREPLERIACRVHGESDADIELAVRAIERRPERGPAFERLAGSLPWLRVRSLGMAASGQLERFVATAAELRDAPVVVLDVRGNAGGSDRFLLRWFASLTSQSLRYFDTSVLTSEVELQGALTFWGCIAAGTSGDDEGRAWLEGRVRDARRMLDRAMRERGVFRELRAGTHLEPGRAPLPFAGRLVVLVDRGCGSACETTVMLARQIEGALVVGENTEGTMKVGELRTFRLPSRAVWLSAGRRVHRDPVLGGFPEGAGYEPDLWLDGRDAGADVRAIAACLVDPRCAAQLAPR